MKLKFKVQMKIGKPVAEVFAAVADPKKLSGYFTNGGASGPLEAGKTVVWTFADNPAEPMDIPVQVKKIVPNERIEFNWAAATGEYDAKAGTYPKPAGYDTLVVMLFEALKIDETLVSIHEGEWQGDPGDLASSYQNAQGWMQMACCLKAYLEYGINLRKGAF